MTKHTLYIATYERGAHPITGKTMPYHWSYFIQLEVQGGQNAGITHQLRGMPGAFHYEGPEDVDPAELGPVKEQLEVGEVDSSKLARVHQILRGIKIDTVESSGWNCQDWTLDGFEELKKEGFVYDFLTKDGLKNWLKES